MRKFLHAVFPGLRRHDEDESDRYDEAIDELTAMTATTRERLAAVGVLDMTTEARTGKRLPTVSRTAR